MIVHRTADGQSFTVKPIDTAPELELPDEFKAPKLAKRTLQIIALLAVGGLVLLFAPGLGEVRALLTDAQPGWVVLAVAFEAMSCVSYVLMFRPIFCQTCRGAPAGRSACRSSPPARSCRRAAPADSPWAPGSCMRAACPRERIASRSVAFFLIKSSVNFIAVAVLGTVMALGLVGPICRRG